MLIIVFIASVLASALNAASSVMEREATGTPEVKELFTRKLILTIARNKKFLAGVGLQLLATVMEIVALSQGSLVVVAPLLTLDLVFLLVFLSRRYHLKVEPQNWVSVVGIVGGLSLLFLCTQPQKDQIRFNFTPWLVTISLITALILFVMYIIPKLKSAKQRAAVLALATATSYGLNSGLVKLCLNELNQKGIAGLFITWPLYVLLVSAALSLYLTQNTFSAGPLVISQPIIEIVQAAVSVAIGIFIFNDDLLHSWLTISGDVFSTVIVAICIIRLAQSDSLFTQKSINKAIQART
jgi:hypothetical protein